MKKPQRLVPSALLAAVLVAGAAVAAPSAAAGTVPARPASAGVPSADDAQQLALPEPTGPFPVGMAPVHLVDEERADPWRPEEHRELMVSLWYPAVPQGEPAPYTTEPVSAAIIEASGFPVAPDLLTTVRTHSYDRARALPGKRPLVVLSPGAGLSRESLTALAEELASRGYVVAGVDHTYEAQGVEFPDGRVAGCLLCELPSSRELGAQVTRGRALDISFVLDELTHGRTWRHGPTIDARHIGVAGHSLGGSTAAALLVDDPRVDAGVNLDGTFQVDFPESGEDDAFLMLGKGNHHLGGDEGDAPNWADNLARLDGPKLWLQLRYANHGSFTDQMLFLEQLGLPVSGTVGGARGVEVTTAYVGAFLDRHLKGKDTPLLDGPSAAYPEIVFWG
ncbi:alpha/beta hydrolase family protein [Promicromonospora vindobonensis]|uniref:Alpha/beta hydrolase family protein n=1 Tax=Promicromonospora vindobonensis TaxID=195748 RepID=A0ABW5W0G6_9MICO